MYCQRKLFKKKRQIVVLLGAGAAIPWGGVTSRDIKLECGNTMNEHISSLLNQFYRLKYTHFETFLAALEEVMNYVISLTNEGKNELNTSFIPAVLRLKKCIIKLLSNKNEVEKRRYCYEIFSTCVNNLINKIDEYNEKVLDEKNAEINKNLIRFTKYFLSKNYSVKYYTTNYDNIIPQVLRKHCNIHEGLYNNSRDGYRRFQPDLGLFRKARLSHFNLHGSIFLRRAHIIGHGYETVYNVAGSIQMDTVIALHENGGNPGERLIFFPVITGYNKTQRAVNQPFSLGFNAFVNDCNDCDALCIVGYSMSDPHINAILSSYIKWNNVRFIHVTKGDNNFLEKLDNEIIRVMERKKNDTWIHDNRKHIYKKGFEEFLKNKSNWEYLI